MKLPGSATLPHVSAYFGIVPSESAVPRRESELELLIRIAETQAQWSDYNQRSGALPGGNYDYSDPIVVGAKASCPD